MTNPTRGRPRRRRTLAKCIPPLLRAGLAAAATVAVDAAAQQAYRDCSRHEAGSMAEAVCRDDALHALDAKMQDLVRRAMPVSIAEKPPRLMGDQRVWKTRMEECRLQTDRTACLESGLRLRIAELEARYALVEGTGPATFVCRETPPDEVAVTFYPTDPPMLMATRAGRTSLMRAVPVASGIRYESETESFQEHKGTATITWGKNTLAMSCRRRKEGERPAKDEGEAKMAVIPALPPEAQPAPRRLPPPVIENVVPPPP